MEFTEYERLAAFENTYWWHVGRCSIIARQLDRLHKEQSQLAILNVGSGTGGTVEMLAAHGNVLNIDQSMEAVRIMEKNGYRAFQMDARHTPLASQRFDLIAALDVLEHIEQDETALKEWDRLLRPGGHLVVTVPAYPWLWSGHDVSMGHYRRYTAKKLKRSILDRGFKVSKCSYAITFSFFPIVVFRFLQKLLHRAPQQSSYVRLPALANSFFTLLLKCEGVLLKKCDFPFGTSVLLVAHKPGREKVHDHVQTIETEIHSSSTLSSDCDSPAAHV